jgi:nucleoid-associated protein EbfC
MNMEVKALQQMLSQFRQAQERLEKQIQELHVEASAGGGMVSVKMNGQKQLTEVKIEADVYASKDQEMLQDLIRAAVNEATRRVDEELSKQVKDLSGGLPGLGSLKIPGLF